MTSKDEPAAKALDLDYALALAIRLHQSRELDDAEELYRTILEQYPRFPEALHFLGLLMHQKGDNTQAIGLIEQAIAEAPEYSDAHNNLGNIFNRLEDFEKAAHSYSQALDLNPDNAAAFNNFGVVLSQLSRIEDAIEAFSKAIALMPENAEFYRNLGNAYKKQGEFALCIEAYRKVIGLKPYNAENYENLCAAMCLQGKAEDAIVLVKQWLEHDPENPLALHRLRSYTGEFDLPRASDEYITQTFDDFADSFDMVLKRLEYKAPFLVSDAVKDIFNQTQTGLDILDAGCGTGLCGPLLKPYAKQLVGIDLSAKMLEKAKKRECYDDLLHAELTECIVSYPARSDVVVSADTLVYFGDLEAVCLAVSGVLLPGGHFVFTLEEFEEDIAQGFKIQPHGRFSHTEAYIQDVILAAGFTMIKLERVMLRYEGGVPVDGFLVVARKVLSQ
ncbi:MAG: tetratricopeptide repeat protein [Methylomonas sp.]|jgi:predicted TPR repeat methyltransferase|uniref:tetratricopeptide repeat protein n=1 Tax=Methylomonas sp. TaxID=418 RepID=UPI0025F1E549|nr:tetratricopeptide repeat protein [Methylomonas sp.]MCK9605179.1 tetratricopeptide repeat protein [Methylomonas sp.]